MTLLAIDPGSGANMGTAIFKDKELQEVALRHIYDIFRLIEKMKPQNVLAIEGQYLSPFRRRGMFTLPEIAGAIKYFAAYNLLKVVVVNPQLLTKHIGLKGRPKRADKKKAAIEYVVKKYHFASNPKSDLADAIVIGEIGFELAQNEEFWIPKQ